MQTNLFHPEKLLGSGPAAKVYQGVEAATGRKVLIKSLLPAHETPHALDPQRLHLFAPSLMQLRHPHIAGLLTLMPAEAGFAIVSEFMPGMNIRALAAARQVPAADLRALAVQLMQALLVGEPLRQPHGDPKPSNVIIADHPAGGMFLQLQDWGLSLTRQHHPAETLWFRAPELHFGGMPSSQSDLFTAAASLFCLATNTAPAQGEAVEALIQQWHAFQAGPVLQHLRPDLDPPLRDWLAWLMQPDPRLRPQCVAHALDALMASAALHTGFIPMPQQAPQMMTGAHTTPLVAMPAPVAAAVPMSMPTSVPPAAEPVAVQALEDADAETPVLVPEAEFEAEPEPELQIEPNPDPEPAPAPAIHANVPKPRPVPRPVAQAARAEGEAVPVAVAVAAGDEKTKAHRAKKGSGLRVAVGVTLNLAALVVAGFFFWPAIAGPQRFVEPAKEAEATATPQPAADAAVAVATSVAPDAKPAATVVPASAPAPAPKKAD